MSRAPVLMLAGTSVSVKPPNRTLAETDRSGRRPRRWRCGHVRCSRVPPGSRPIALGVAAREHDLGGAGVDHEAHGLAVDLELGMEMAVRAAAELDGARRRPAPWRRAGAPRAACRGSRRRSPPWRRSAPRRRGRAAPAKRLAAAPAEEEAGDEGEEHQVDEPHPAVGVERGACDSDRGRTPRSRRPSSDELYRERGQQDAEEPGDDDDPGMAEQPLDEPARARNATQLSASTATITRLTVISARHVAGVLAGEQDHRRRARPGRRSAALRAGRPTDRDGFRRRLVGRALLAALGALLEEHVDRHEEEQEPAGDAEGGQADADGRRAATRRRGRRRRGGRRRSATARSATRRRSPSVMPLRQRHEERRERDRVDERRRA